MQLRRLLLGFALASVGQTQGIYKTITVTTIPASTTTPSCSQQACATYTNECGLSYGGCFPICSGNTVPAFTPPPCPILTTTTTTTTTSPSPSRSSSTRCPTVCWDLMNTCSMWYGGCKIMCGSYSRPSFTPPPCPTSSSATEDIATITAPAPFSAASAARIGSYVCSRTVCWDYMNDCGLKYGGCHDDCDDSPMPTFYDPGCPSKSSSIGSLSTQTKEACAMSCPLHLDGCGNTFGPGCYTSCPGMAPPSFTTPFCKTSKVTTVVATTRDMRLKR